MIENSNTYINSFNQQIYFCIKNWPMWFYTSINDNLIRFRRTKLGNIWSIVANLLIISLMCLVWSVIFKLDIKNFYPYLMNGFIIYALINSSLTESLGLIHERYKQIYLNIPIPLLLLVIRGISKEVFDYFVFLPIILLVFIIQGFNLLILPFFFIGFIILIIFLILSCSILSICSTRFRDIPPLVRSLLSILTLLTPIFWKKEMLGEYQNWVYLNPFTFIIEVLRDPLLGILPDFKVYMFSILLIIFLYIVNVILLKFKGSRVVFWI